MKPVATLVVALLAAVGVAVVAPSASAQATEATLTGVTQLSVGDDHTCVRTNGARARCWGDNNDGQLGDNSLFDRGTAVTVLNQGGGGALTGVRQIAAGGDHTCAALANGQARCWGDNDNGQLGNNSIIDADLPVTVLNQGGGGPLTGVASVSAGDDFTCARLSSGQVRCWGQGTDAQLGNDASVNSDLPVTVLAASGAALTGVTSLEVGGDHACVILSSGQARCWGNGALGRLGTNNESTVDRAAVVRGTTGAALTGVTQISGGNDHSCARLTTAKAVCWGHNGLGELGDGTTSVSLRPAFVANGGGDGDLIAVTAIDANDDSTCARLTNGQARCWGDNDNGQYGNNTVVNAVLPTVVRNGTDSGPLPGISVVLGASDHTCALVTGGQVRCWGDNGNGQLGDDTLVDKLLPVVVQV